MMKKRLFLLGTVCSAVLLFAASAGATPQKVDTKAFNDFFTEQSRVLYDRLMRAGEYANSLAQKKNAATIKEALAVRASLKACWELFLNAGDMVYMYDLVDPGCWKTVAEFDAMLGNGLAVVAGKLEKELLWLNVAAGYLSDQPVKYQVRQAKKEIKAVAAFFLREAGKFKAAAEKRETEADKTTPPKRPKAHSDEETSGESEAEGES